MQYNYFVQVCEKRAVNLELLKQKIISDGDIIHPDIVKVDMFLNHQLDINLLDEMGKEFFRLFKDSGITKILTIESSGIAIACFAAKYFSVPVVFAKKGNNRNIGSDTYSTEIFSFTKASTYTAIVSKKYLSNDDRVLIIDDFLANGKALTGLLEIVKQSGAEVCGVGIAIEKAFQPGGKALRENGIRIESLAKIESVSDGKINFAD